MEGVLQDASNYHKGNDSKVLVTICTESKLSPVHLSSASEAENQTSRLNTAASSSAIDCRSLPRTSDLVAIFEKNIQDYRTCRSPRKNRNFRSNQTTPNVTRVESFTLRQRQKLKAPPQNLGLSESDNIVRLRPQTDRNEVYEPTKRVSSGLRIACPTAKSALLAGVNRTPTSGYLSSNSHCYPSASNRASWRVFRNEEHFNTSCDYFSTSTPVLRSTSKVTAAMSPITVVTTSATHSMTPTKVGLRLTESNTPGSVNSTNDSGAETMTSYHSAVTSCESTPSNTFGHASSDQEGSQSPGHVYQSTLTRSFNSRVANNATSERLTFRGGGGGEGDVLSDSAASNSSTYSWKSPTSIIRKTKLSNFKFCGLNRGASKERKNARDPYIASPTHAPSTPEITHYRIFRSKKDPSLRLSASTAKSSSSEDQLDSLQCHGPVKVRTDSPIKVIKQQGVLFSHCAPAKTKIDPSSIRVCTNGEVLNGINYTHVAKTDSPAGKNREENGEVLGRPDKLYLHQKTVSVTSDDNLSMGTTVDDDCELASIPDSVSSRGQREQRLTSGNSSVRSSVSLKNRSSVAGPRGSVVLSPTNHNSSRPSEALMGNGANVDEETFQKVMNELNDMRGLLSTLMRQLHAPSSLENPLDDALRTELFRRFNFTNTHDSPLFQDASTQTALEVPDSTQ